MSALEGLLGEALGDLAAYHPPAEPLPTKLDANESPWALPDDVRDDLAERVRALPLHRYPDPYAARLRAALATRVGATPDELLLGAGSDEVIGVLLRALDRPRAPGGKPVVIAPTPSFVMYDLTSRVQGFEPVFVPLADGWGLDVDAMRAAIEARAPNVVFLATPNNPTGNAFGDDALAAVVEAAPRSLVVIDEAYAPFAGRSLSGWVDRYPNVAVMGTLSKVGLAALRVGWLRVAADLRAELDKCRPPYNLPAPSQVMAEALLTTHAAALDDQVARIVAERERLAAALDALPGLAVSPSRANFLLVQVPDGARWHEALRAAGVQVRRFGDPRLANALRITVGRPEENDRLLEALSALSPAIEPTIESL